MQFGFIAIQLLQLVLGKTKRAWAVIRTHAGAMPVPHSPSKSARKTLSGFETQGIRNLESDVHLNAETHFQTNRRGRI
jgi:hypothetical protein